MNKINSIHELIGHTPIIELHHMDFPENVHVYAKLELYNPGGSIKDRIGQYMVEDAFKNHKLKRGGTIVEATAGNTGLGIALAALHKNVHVIFVVPEKFSIEKQVLMQALGAEIVHTPEELGMQGAIQKANELEADIPDAIALRQFSNPMNPMAHYERTGPEIWNDLDGQIDFFVAGAGSGGTYSGIMKYLKEQNSGIQGILADPIGSTIGGGVHAPYAIEGIGNDFIADTMDMSLVDMVIKVSDENAYAQTRKLAKQEGIIAGSSSGAGLAAIMQLIEKGASGNIVTVFPDRGDRYFSEGLFKKV